MKKQLIVFISVMLATLILLTGCDKVPNADNTTTPADTTTAETTESNFILLLDENNDDYKIIRPEKAEEYEVNAAVNLNRTLMDKYDDIWDRKLTDDFVKGKKGEIIENNEKEILIGYTNRKESQDVYKTLKEDEYTIRVVNWKIVIIGENQYATATAVAEFIENYVNKADGKTFSIPRDLDQKGICELRKVPVHSSATYRIMTYNVVGADGNVEQASELILRYLPDIIGFQECNKNAHTKIVSTLPDYYSVANEFHSNKKTYNYTPIAYNTNLFTLVDSGLEWLDGRYTGTNTKSIAWALFEDKNGARFAVINFHGAVCSASYKGFENMTDAERSQQALTWRIDNVRQIIEIKDRIFKKHGTLPLMVTGDYNFNSSSEPYKNLTAGGFEEAELIAKNKTAGYKTYYKFGSTTTAQKGLSIDHIFRINGIDFISFNTVRDPIAFTASDHIPVYADFNVIK